MRLLTVFGILICCVTAAAQGPGANARDEASIRELVARYEAARDSEDAAAIEALFTAEADQLVSSGVWRKGRDELVRGMLGSSRRNPGDRTLTVESVRLVSPDVAVADARYEISGRPGVADRKMWSTFLAQRTPDGWRISAIRNMLPAP